MPGAAEVGHKVKSKQRPKKSRTVRAGLIFSVSRVLRILKDGRYARRVAPKAAIYLAAVLEYLSAEILELSEKAAIINNRKIIQPRHFLLAVKSDEDLDLMLKGVTVAQGGFVPRIHTMKFKKPPTSKLARDNTHESQAY